ncbi:MAG TPA: pantetheine-phosphate adenylyltransferase [Candidatus Polarisedimenticolia bacterium]|nr:pantetheine-phosphate adenylyltransferase [Candidatus Polarisedimenticolia bacterium]
MKVLAVYPGSFDPVTHGHLDIIRRGSRLFDRIVVAVLKNPEKKPMFPLAERRRILRQATREIPNVSIDSFDGLLVDYARRRKARVIVRGLRALSDFEYEFQMALMNRRLDATIETVFMMPSEAYSYLSSRLVKEVARLGGSVAGLVPPEVERRLGDKMGGRRSRRAVLGRKR